MSRQTSVSSDRARVQTTAPFELEHCASVRVEARATAIVQHKPELYALNTNGRAD